jgi:hypothetical protein
MVSDHSKDRRSLIRIWNTSTDRFVKAFTFTELVPIRMETARQLATCALYYIDCKDVALMFYTFNGKIMVSVSENNFNGGR